MIDFQAFNTNVRNTKCELTAIACYINFARIGNTILFPQFAIPEDEDALQAARSTFGGYGVIPVALGKLLKDGRVQNCVT